MRFSIGCLLAAGVMLLAAGCASPNVNPSKPRAGMGYVDFYAGDPDLNWQVECYDNDSKSFRTAYAELKPPGEGILRLAYAPGEHLFRIAFLNRVLISAAEIKVNVEAGRIIPVRLSLTEASSVQVETRTYSYGTTFRGGYGRRAHIQTKETKAYDATATAGAPLAYQPKEKMNYGK